MEQGFAFVVSLVIEYCLLGNQTKKIGGQTEISFWVLFIPGQLFPLGVKLLQPGGVLFLLAAEL